MELTKEQAESRLNSGKNLAFLLKNRSRPMGPPSPTVAIEESDSLGPISSEAPEPEPMIEPEAQDCEIIPPAPSANPSQSSVINIRRAGNRTGNSLTLEQRTLIAARARAGEKQKDLAAEFGVTQAHVSYLENGKAEKVDEATIANAVSGVRDLALERLMATLGLITDDKLSGESARSLSGIGASLARIVESTNPREAAQSNGATVIIYSPEIRSEKGFQTLEI